MPITAYKAGSKKFHTLWESALAISRKIWGFFGRTFNFSPGIREFTLPKPTALPEAARHCTHSEPTMPHLELHTWPGQCPGTQGASPVLQFWQIWEGFSPCSHTSPSSWMPRARGIGSTHNIYSHYVHYRTNINKKCLVCLIRPNVIAHFNE